MCFHCVFGFSVFRFFGFVRQKVCVPKIGFGWSARKSVYLKSGLGRQEVCVPKIGFGLEKKFNVGFPVTIPVTIPVTVTGEPGGAGDAAWVLDIE